MKYFILSVGCLLLLVCSSISQKVNWLHYDTSISKKINLDQLNDSLEQIKSRAKTNQDDITQARCWYYQLQIADTKRDDTLFFTNSFFIDSLLENKAINPLLRSVMFVFKAKRIALFRHQFFYHRKKLLFEKPGSAVDYRLQTIKQLDSICQASFDSALLLPGGRPEKLPVEQLLWLASDPWLFLFKPAYQDIVFAEKIACLQLAANDAKNTSDQWLALTPEQLLQADTLPSGIHINLKPVYGAYRSWANANRSNPEAYFFIESLARKFFYQHNLNTEEVPLYEQYLQQSLRSPYAAVRGHAVYKLALYWEQLGKKYQQGYLQVQYKPAYRPYYTKAVELIATSQQLLDSFNYLKEKLYLLSERIKHPELNISMQTNQLPGDSIALEVACKNAASFRYTIVCLSSYEQLRWKGTQLSVADLLNQNPWRSAQIGLPVTTDYQTHMAKLNVPGLPVGRYAIVYGINSLNEDSEQPRFLTFEVTTIAVINNDSRVFVLNRCTGKPMAGATMKVQYNRDYNTKMYQTFTTTVNAEGYAIVDKPYVEDVMVISGDDTIVTRISQPQKTRGYDGYDGEDDEDLFDFYEEEIRLHMFTDRSIYRPGQTVHFKGMLITRDPVTGKPIVLNKKNMQFGWLKKLFDKKVKELSKGSFDLYLEDALGQQVDTIKVITNKYGSFTGSYVVSKKAATGDWEFTADDIDLDNNNNGAFKVEEYKRPTFAVQLIKPTNFLQFGDSAFVKVKVKSFAGASLTDVAIQYNVTATLNTPAKSNGEYGGYINKQVADSSGHTDAAGELLIKLPADFLKEYQFSDKEMYSVNYQVDVTAIDPGGESHEENIRLTLDNRPVKIEASVKNIYERRELNQLYLKTKSVYSGYFLKPVNIQIYSFAEKESAASNNNGQYDYRIVNNQWEYITPDTTSRPVKKRLIYDGVADSLRFIWPQQLLKTGDYEMVFTCYEKEKIVGQRTVSFAVFDEAQDQIPVGEKQFEYLPVNSVASGDSIKWYTGSSVGETYSIFHAQYYAATGKGIALQHQYSLVTTQQHVDIWRFAIPANATGDVKLTRVYINNNEIYNVSETVYVLKTAITQREIRVEQYRKILTPGAAENFVVSIKTGDAQVAAELMTTMYDASLDKLNKHKWELPNQRTNNYNTANWANSINHTINQYYQNQRGYTYILPARKGRVQPLWWLNPLDYAYDSIKRISFISLGGNNNLLSGRVAGVQITESDGLNEVVVVGYGTTKRRDLTGAVSKVTIRGAASLSSFNIPLVIIDGVVYEGDINKINVDLITDALVLKDAEATAIYGARASQGVIVISTKGPIELPQAPEQPVVVRKNFAETAFFFPQVHADANGMYNIQFEIPESVTEWNWKMLAHTKAAEFMYLQKTINTQLPMMVQPNMPRFLYQGDVIDLQTRVTNLDSAQLSGSSTCRVEDAVTGEDITSKLLSQKQQSFSVDKKSNSNVTFKLAVPDNFLHPIKIRITASAGSFSDGEEYTIPVMSKAILVSQNIPFVIGSHADTLLKSPALPADAAMYGMAMYISPKPQAALINALPYLANYSYNCAEQTVNKLLANATALKLLRTDTIAQQTMAQFGQLPDPKPQALPDELSEQTMPWLQLDHATQVQQQQLRQLLDSSAAKSQIEKYMSRLAQLQNADGGSAWFDGGKSNRYISNYLLNAFGKLAGDSLPFLVNKELTRLYSKYISGLIAYCDKTVEDRPASYLTGLQYLYARRHWLGEYELSPGHKKFSDSMLQVAWSHANELDLNDQAMLVSASLVFKGDQQVHYKRAIARLESLRQLSVSDPVAGLRWKALSNADDLTNSGEETISNLALAFEESGQSKQVVAGIIQWLMQTKQQDAWSNTKATATVIGLLQKQQPALTGTPVSLKSGALNVSDNLLQGKLTDFTLADNLPATISVQQSGSGLASGGFNLYYFTAQPPSNEQNTGTSISKQLKRLNKATQQWEPVSSRTRLHIADKLQTTITINARKQLQYVFIDEKRAAALEPADGNSGYQYASGFGYYMSVRDAGYQFFAEQIPAGQSTITYETVVSKEGSFSNGPISLQCMYQPALRVYGMGEKITVEQ